MQDSEPKNIAELYNSPEGQLGPLLFGGHLHWGYWDKDNVDANFAVAAEKMAQIMIGKTQIQAGQRFIDLGCGVGQPAMELAKAKGCSVDGITISQFQQQSATAKAKAEGMQNRLNFIHGSALKIPCKDHSYEGGWFFESIFHMGHREALLEASRVLKPGAVLVLTDLPTLATTTADFKAFVQEHIHSTFIARQDYPELMAEAGFELIEIQDITENVMPHLLAKFKQALDEHKKKLMELKIDDIGKKVDNWIYLFEYMSENLGYMIVTARKL